MIWPSQLLLWSCLPPTFPFLTLLPHHPVSAASLTCPIISMKGTAHMLTFFRHLLEHFSPAHSLPLTLITLLSNPCDPTDKYVFTAHLKESSWKACSTLPTTESQHLEHCLARRKDSINTDAATGHHTAGCPHADPQNLWLWMCSLTWQGRLCWHDFAVPTPWVW